MGRGEQWREEFVQKRGGSDINGTREDGAKREGIRDLREREGEPEG